jgi:hypothetical protein
MHFGFRTVWSVLGKRSVNRLPRPPKTPQREEKPKFALIFNGQALPDRIARFRSDQTGPCLSGFAGDRGGIIRIESMTMMTIMTIVCRLLKESRSRAADAVRSFVAAVFDSQFDSHRNGRSENVDFR